VNKSELIAKVAKTAKTTKTTAADLVNTVFETISLELTDGGSVKLSGFGYFLAKTRPASTGRNPRTGEEIRIPEMIQAKFKPTKELKDVLAG